MEEKSEAYQEITEKLREADTKIKNLETEHSKVLPLSGIYYDLLIFDFGLHEEMLFGSRRHYS